MIIIYILAILAYLIFNSIITISWLADSNYRHKTVMAIVFMLFGLPIMIIVVTVAIICGIIGVFKNE